MDSNQIVVEKINIEIISGLAVKDVTGGLRQDDLRVFMWI